MRFFQGLHRVSQAHNLCSRHRDQSFKGGYNPELAKTNKSEGNPIVPRNVQLLPPFHRAVLNDCPSPHRTYPQGYSIPMDSKGRRIVPESKDKDEWSSDPARTLNIHST